MKIKVLFDKDALNSELKTGWGVSFLIDDKVLFDTGEKGEWLLGNMKKLGVDLDKIEAVVISHDHWDHKDGVWDLLKQRPGLKVYGCPRFGKKFKQKVKSSGGKLIEVDKFTKITDDIYTTGEILGRYILRPLPEQVLAVKTQKGIVVLTGCAHPGIIKIIEKIKENLPERIYLVLGGFHLMEKDEPAVKEIISRFRQLGIQRAGPTHCTGERAIELFRDEYTSNFMPIKVGRVIEV
ncbi:MAG: MBL fold metallo-hydrolase [Candidatus Omnitrophica bacterium]|nr:MBL fold metallo-hydrolase [Candidatus Omnitrophota bacterium]MBU4590519.1 MBL fold metallo-hydrolase [Candidatus Omnitrophota bacterium]